MKISNTTHFFLKLPLAISMLGHGLVRIPKLEAFSTWMVSAMEKSVIPEFVIRPFGYVLPFLETLIGIMLLTNIQPKNTLYLGIITMSLLMLGSCSVENWDAVAVQLFHGFYFAFLLLIAENNKK